MLAVLLGIFGCRIQILFNSLPSYNWTSDTILRRLATIVCCCFVTLVIDLDVIFDLDVLLGFFNFFEHGTKTTHVVIGGKGKLYVHGILRNILCFTLSSTANKNT